jgi:apolipoprotein D and lipocalin family protein
MKNCRFLALGLALLLPACRSNEEAPPPVTAERVELTRYLGRWHEIARLPMPFQKEREAAIAEYGLRPDGEVSVRNIAVRADGTTREVRGQARVLNPGANSRLLVRFNEWFSVFIPQPEAGNYWILHVDADYQTALVGSPDRRYLWVLARQPALPEATLQRLLQVARDQGYDTQRLIRSAQHPPRA